MILVPGYLKSRTDEIYTAVLGSEPKPDAPVLEIPAACVSSCIESGTSTPFGTNFAVFIFDESKMTPELKTALGIMP